MHVNQMAALIIACSLVSACVPGVPTGTESGKPGARKAGAATPRQDATKTFTGRVLGLGGQPAAGVVVRSYLIGQAGGNLIGQAGGNLIGQAGGNYRLLDAASQVKTDEDGTFTLDFPATGELNVEAVQQDDIKAIRLGVAKGAEAFELRLARTGSISGKVTAPDAPGISDFTGVDVFIPGTSYLAKADASGSFTISGVPVGTFTLFASKTGLGTAQLAGVAVASEKTTTAPDLTLAVAAPRITALSETVVGPGMALTLTGENFGLTGGKTFQVTIGGIVASDPRRVDDQTIEVKVPDGAASGDVLVTVEGIAGPGRPITVLKSLSLAHNYSQLVRGEDYAFTATGKDTRDLDVSGPPVSWELVEGSAVTLDATGQLSAAALGTAAVRIKRGTVVSEPFLVEVVPFLYGTSAFVGSGKEGSQNGQGDAAAFDALTELAIDSQGNLFVLERVGETSSRIRKVTPEGTVSTFSSNLAYTVKGLTLDHLDRLFVTAPLQKQILRVEAGGVITPYAGRAGATSASDGTLLPDGENTPADFEMPMHMAHDGAGAFYMSDDVEGDDWIRKITPAGVVTISNNIPWSTAVPGVGGVWSVAADGAGSVYWASGMELQELVGNTLAEFTGCKLFRLSDGIPSLLAGGGSGDGAGAEAGFGIIASIDFDADGNLIVADMATVLEGGVTRKLSVRHVTPEGVVSTIAGGKAGYREGRGKLASFEAIGDLAVAADGTIYVLDAGAWRIRKVKRVSK